MCPVRACTLWKLSNGCGLFISILKSGAIISAEFCSVPFVSPGPDTSICSASGFLPLRLCWQSFTCPHGIGDCILPFQDNGGEVWGIIGQTVQIVFGFVTGFGKELFVLFVRYFILVNVEGIDKDSALGTFVVKPGDSTERKNLFVVFDIGITGSHEEFASGHIDHYGFIFRGCDRLNGKGTNERGICSLATGKR